MGLLLLERNLFIVERGSELYFNISFNNANLIVWLAVHDIDKIITA
jgi:hypothetical protein